MNKQLFLHLGTNRSGSTTLQNMFCQIDKLSARHMYFSDEWTLGEKVASCTDGNTAFIESERDRLLHKIDQSGKKINIISSENFYTPFFYDNEHTVQGLLRRIKTLFGGFNLKILLIYRRQDRLIESQYMFNLKNKINFRLNFDDFLSSVPFSGYDWHRHVSLIESFFPRDSIHITPFELITKDQTLFAKDIFDFLNVDTSRFKTMILPHHNKGLNKEGVEYVLSLPPNVKSLQEQAKLRAMLEERFPITKGDRMIFFSNSQRQEFLSRFIPSNYELFQKYNLDISLWHAQR